MSRIRTHPRSRAVALAALLGATLLALPVALTSTAGAVPSGTPSLSRPSDIDDVDGDGIPDFDPAGQPYDHRWIEVSSAADELDRLLFDRPEFGGVTASRDDYSLVLYWNGSEDSLPPEVVALLNEHHATVTTEDVIPRPELQAAVDAIVAEYDDVAVTIQPGGLVLWVAPDHPILQPDRLESIGVPILEVRDPIPPPIPMSRDNDTGSLDGGSFIVVGGSQACGAGMTALRSNGTRVMLTAQHCFSLSGSTSVEAPNGRYLPLDPDVREFL